MKKAVVLMLLGIQSLCFGVDSRMEMLISREEIAEKIKQVGEDISRDYADKKLTVLMVMKGSVCLAADLIRNIDIPLQLDYLKASSYGMGGMQGGDLTIAGFDQLQLEGRDVLIIDDIFETGNTLSKIKEKIKEKRPNSIQTLVLLMKDIPRKMTMRPEYVLFDIQDYFVIGYGLDYKECYRGLPDICYFVDNIPPF